MGIMEATRTCFANYARFSGRASRPEFWWFVLVYALCMTAAALVDLALFGHADVTVAVAPDETAAAVEVTRRHRPLEILVWLVFFLPLLSAGWRRMQDTGRPGMLLLAPLAISLAAGAFLFLGVLGFSLLEMIGLDGQFLRMLAASLGLFGIVTAAVAYVAMRILILWWLTRPSQKGANPYGRQPAL